MSPYILGLNKQLVLSVYSVGTTDGQILHRTQQTFTILSREVGCPGAAASAVAGISQYCDACIESMFVHKLSIFLASL